MTSKALEAARHELRTAMEYRGPGDSDAQLNVCVRAIIRIFADNLSEDAAEAGSIAAAQAIINSVRSGQATLNAAERAGIRAAIAKDLE